MSDGRRAPVLRYLRQAVGAPPAGGVSDADLLARFAAGRDEAAFELLLWRHGGMVLNVCRAVLRDAAAAEDAFQATFLVLVRKAGSISRREAVGGWLYRVAYRAALKARRRAAAAAARLAPGADLAALPGAGGAADGAAVREVRRLLCEEVQRLPAKYRAPVVACYFEARTHEEAASHLGWSKGTLAGRLARARELLRRRLARRGVALGAGCLAAALAPGTASAAALVPLINPTLQAAARFAAGTAVPAASGPAAALAEGVLRTMVWTRMKLTAAAVLAVALAGTGAVFTGRPAAGAQDEQGTASAPKVRPVAGRAAEGAPASDAKARAESRENLKRIALAMHEYHNQHGRLPAPTIYGRDKKALLSWRVAILPWLQQDALYKQFHLDEPWDSPHNIKLAETFQVKTYMPVGGAKAPPGYTFYQVFVGPGAGFEKHRQMRMADVTDGLSNTILVVEAGKPVPWTKPEDLHYAADEPLPELGGLFRDVFQAAFMDGAAYTLKKKYDEKTLRLAITRADGQTFDLDKLLAERPAPPPRRGVKDLLDAASLRDLTEARRAEMQRQREMVEALQREVEALKAAREKDKPRPAPDLAALERENQRLEKELRKLQDQVAALRDEIRRLKQGPARPAAPKPGR